MAQIKPKGIAPELFTLAWRKRLTVAQALSGGRWMKGLRRILTTSQIDQFVHLYGLFCPPDIQWRFITCPPNQHIEFSSLGHTRTSTGESSGRLRRGGEQMQSYVWACRLLLQMRFASSAAPARSPPQAWRGWASPSNHCPADPVNWSARTCTKGRLHHMAFFMVSTHLKI
jgi:hypothetical protein